MAKAKPTKAPKSLSASESKSKKSTTKTVTPKATTGKKSAPQSATPKSEFTHIAIGHAAGDIWGLLSTDGPKTIAELVPSMIRCSCPSVIPVLRAARYINPDWLSITSTLASVNGIPLKSKPLSAKGDRR